MNSRTIRFPASADSREDGIVVDVQSLGYGFDEPQCPRSRSNPSCLADVLLELTTELSIEILGKGVISEEGDRCIHPGQRPRAREIARAS